MFISFFSQSGSLRLDAQMLKVNLQFPTTALILWPTNFFLVCSNSPHEKVQFYFCYETRPVSSKIWHISHCSSQCCIYCRFLDYFSSVNARTSTWSYKSRRNKKTCGGLMKKTLSLGPRWCYHFTDAWFLCKVPGLVRCTCRRRLVASYSLARLIICNLGPTNRPCSLYPEQNPHLAELV